MSAGLLSKDKLHKTLATQPSDERIALVMTHLEVAPQRLRHLAAGLSETELTRPLGEGERSFKRDLTHLCYCAERGSDPIHHALLLKEPLMPRIHAERDWGALMRYEEFSIPELLDYFQFRRRALMRILRGLRRRQWERTVRRESLKRSESVYYAARGLCLHEQTHLEDLAKKLGVTLSP